MRRKKKSISKYATEAVIIETTITEVIEKNKIYSEKIKNVFKCSSSTGTDKTCIIWGRRNLDVGDKIQMQGRIKDDIFLAWSLIIIKKGETDLTRNNNR